VHKLSLVLAMLVSLSTSMRSAWPQSAILGIEKANSSAVTILFVNGINNQRVEAAASSDALIQSLKATGLPLQTYNFDYFYNPTQGMWPDNQEVARQLGLSDTWWRASSGARNEYYRLLGNDYDAAYGRVLTLPALDQRVVLVAVGLKQKIEAILAKSAGVIVVPHSQGNLYAEAAYAMLVAEGRTDVVARVRVVGVADAAVTTPSNRYITHDSDWVITQAEPLLASALGLTVRPLQPDVTACVGPRLVVCGGSIDWKNSIGDGLAHSFVNVYLNSNLYSQADDRQFPKVIYDLVTASLAELPRYAQVGAVHYLNFTLYNNVPGNPGVAGDGQTVSEPSSYPYWVLSTPISLRGTTNGYTLTVFLPPGQSITGVGSGVGSNWGPASRACGISDGTSTVVPSPVTVNGVTGYSFYYSQSYLDSQVAALNQSGTCNGAVLATGDLYFYSFIVQGEGNPNGPLLTTLDAAAVGAGPDAIPVASTPPPVDITPF